MRSDDPDADPLVELEKRVRRLERGSDLGYSSISEGSLRVASMEGLIVQGSERVTGLLLVDGTLTVTGVESITGTLVVSGGQIITGTFRIDGETTINGQTRFNGPTDIFGALGLSGTLTVKPGGNIDVQNGQIKVGTAMVFDPNVSSGAVVFSNGSQVFTDDDTIQLFKGNGVAQVSDAYAKLQWGGATVQIDADGIHVTGANADVQYRLTLNGRVFATNLPTVTSTGAVPGTVMLTSNQELVVALS